MSINLKKTLTTLAILIFAFFLCFHYCVFGSFRINIFNTNIFTIDNLTFKIFLSIAVFLLFVVFWLLFKYSNLDNKKCIKFLYNERWFFALMVFSGLLFSILIPLFQTPDELTHLNLLCSELNIPCPFSISNDYNDSLRIINSIEEKINPSTYFVFNECLVISDAFTIPNILVIRHFPQAVVYLICGFLHLPVLVTLTLCEFGAVIFYSWICYRALKILPTKKLMMMCIMLFPVCIQQMCSFSYDVVLLSFSFYYISYVLLLKFSKKTVGWCQVAKILIIIAVIGIIKLPYVIMIFLIFIIPKEKFKFRFGSRYLDYEFCIRNKAVSLFAILFIISSLCIFASVFLKDLFIWKLCCAFILNLKDTFCLVWRTLFTFMTSFHQMTLIEFYLSSMTGWFGQLDVKTSFIFTLFVFVSLLMFTLLNYGSNNKILPYKFSRFDTVLCIVLFVFISLAIILAMFEHTLFISDANYNNLSISELGECIKSYICIQGVQGRYFIPILPLIFMVISCRKASQKFNNYNYKFYTIFYYISIIAYSTFTILFRYWFKV